MEDLLNNRYKIISEISKGSEGIVYKATDVTTNKNVAIKKLKLNYSFSNSEESYFELFHDNLCHKNLLCYHEFFTEDGYYIAMEYIDGPDFQGIIDKGKRINTKTLINIFNQILTGLSVLHNSGTIHRDIKPSNILLDKNNTVKIADFGFTCFFNLKKPLCKYKIGNKLYKPSSYWYQNYPAYIDADLFAISMIFYQLSILPEKLLVKDIAKLKEKKIENKLKLELYKYGNARQNNFINKLLKISLEIPEVPGSANGYEYFKKRPKLGTILKMFNAYNAGLENPITLNQIESLSNKYVNNLLNLNNIDISGNKENLLNVIKLFNIFDVIEINDSRLVNLDGFDKTYYQSNNITELKSILYETYSNEIEILKKMEDYGFPEISKTNYPFIFRHAALKHDLDVLKWISDKYNLTDQDITDIIDIYEKRDTLGYFEFDGTEDSETYKWLISRYIE